MHSEGSVTLTRKIAKGQPIFAQGEPANAAYLVLKGRVMLSVGLGHELQIRLFSQHSGAVLGLAETVLGTEYVTTATAATKVIVHTISRADLLDIMKEPESRITVLSLLTEKLSQLYEVLRKTSKVRGHSASLVLPRTHRGSNATNTQFIDPSKVAL